MEDAVSFREVLAPYDEYFTFVRRAETSWIARRVAHLERVCCVSHCGNEIGPKKHSRPDRDMVVMSNALLPLSAAECGSQFDSVSSQEKAGYL